MHPSDRRAAALLLGFFSFLYVYFFQGGGWNQNSQFDAVRALVEDGTFEITRFASNSGDVSVFEGRVYSNKPPGLALAAAPFYLLLNGAERLLGFDPSAPATASANAHALSFLVSGLPAASLVVLLFLHFRRRGSKLPAAVMLSAGFGAGSLALPYAGALFHHNLVAACAFGSWSLVSEPRPGSRRALAAGALLGLAVLSDYTAAPLAALFAADLFRRAPRSSEPWLFLAGPLAAAAALAGYAHSCFGSVFATTYTHTQSAHFAQGAGLGIFRWPSFENVFWLTLHPFRGLLYCCPLFFLSLLARPGREDAVPLMVVAYLFVFNLAYLGWHGGWGVGPRYFAAALPFLYSIADRGYARFPRLAAALIALSAVEMLAVTAVWAVSPFDDPVLESLKRLLRGEVSANPQSVLERLPAPDGAWASYNLGELLGLRGAASLLPLFAAAAAFGSAFRARRAR